MGAPSDLMEIPHPGEFIAEELEARGWLQRDLAGKLGVPEQTVHMIVSGKRDITPALAKAMGDAFDVNPEFFTNLQSAHDTSIAAGGAPKPTPRLQAREVL